MKLLIALALCAISVSAAAQDWVHLGRGGGIEHYADRQSISTDGKLVSAHVLEDYKKTRTARIPKTKERKKYKSSVILAHFDCKEEKWGFTEATDYSGNMGQGEAVARSKHRLMLETIDPGTVGALRLNFVCARAAR